MIGDGRDWSKLDGGWVDVQTPLFQIFQYFKRSRNSESVCELLIFKCESLIQIKNMIVQLINSVNPFYLVGCQF